MSRPAKAKGKPPHSFVLEALVALNPEVRRMFSGFAVYVGDRLVFMLRDHAKSARDNGVWLVLSEGTDPADPGLRREFPSLRRIELLGNKIAIGSSSPVTVLILRWSPCTRAICSCATMRGWAEFLSRDAGARS